MTNENIQIQKLKEKLELLIRRQEAYSKELYDLRLELYHLTTNQRQESKEQENDIEKSGISKKTEELEYDQIEAPHPAKSISYNQSDLSYTPPIKESKFKKDFERFIGENLINKIGIIILIIGVAIGARYAIEHQMVSPLMRIIFGYLIGLGLLGTSLKIKLKYENFSAVLLSGSMAIMYFITYSAYSFYSLIPQALAFILMVIFTIFTVVAALHYNKQVIAHIGMIGAYAVPFILSDGSGKVAVLFSYIAIINSGLLVVAYKKYWKPIYYSSFGLTWLIFLSWYIFSYKADSQFSISLTFLFINFAIFYLTFLAYKLIQKEKFNISDVVLLISNSFIFYGIGYNMLSDHETGQHLLGLFTLINAIIHFSVGIAIYKQELVDKNIKFLILGLVLVFITITIPVQLDGNWVTLLWIGEATLLFWIGRTKNTDIYEFLSYPLIILAFISIVQDWTLSYNLNLYGWQNNEITPFFNINFLSSIIFIIGLGFINYLIHYSKYTSPILKYHELSRLINYILPILLVVLIYFAFRMEIENYWNHLFANSRITIPLNDTDGSNSYIYNLNLIDLKNIWIINYSLVFFSILTFVNLKYLKSQFTGYTALILNSLILLTFLINGLYELSELRENYLQAKQTEYYQTGIFNILIRYISIALAGIIVILNYKQYRKDYIKVSLAMTFDYMLHVSLLWVISSELLNWLDIFGSANSYKLGLSILWGVYSLSLVIIGLWKRKKHLRIAAFVLFGITLLKLFFYDIAHLGTISKTIVFVSLGILLLIISFLYNKYKNIISNEQEA